MLRALLVLSAFGLGVGCTQRPALGDYDSGVVIPDAYANDDALPRDRGTSDSGFDAGTRTTTYTWFRDVQPVVYAACLNCHLSPPRFGAPMALETIEQFHALGRDGVSQVHELAGCRVVGCNRSNIMPPRTEQRQLTTREIQMIQDWSMGGAPAGEIPDGGLVFPDASDPHDAGYMPWADGGTDPDAGTNQRWLDIFAHTPGNRSTNYHVPTQATSYICWSFPTGSLIREHITRFVPIVDNVQHSHHALVFIDRTGTETSPNVTNFECEGIPQNTDLIGGWFPGWPDTVTPPGVGVPITARDRVVFQMHYDSVLTPDVFDNTGFRLLVDANPAIADTGVLWVGARWARVLNGPNEFVSGECTLDSDITIWAVSPHMHQAGLHVQFDISRQGGPWEVNTNVTPWDFHNQQIYPMSPYLQLRSGDRLRTQCWYDTQGRDVRAGEGSLDEMCYTFVNHYPPLTNPFRRCVNAIP